MKTGPNFPPLRAVSLTDNGHSIIFGSSHIGMTMHSPDSRGCIASQGAFRTEMTAARRVETFGLPKGSIYKGSAPRSNGGSSQTNPNPILKNFNKVMAVTLHMLNLK
jgi:hypothetical protein